MRPSVAQPAVPSAAPRAATVVSARHRVRSDARGDVWLLASRMNNADDPRYLLRSNARPPDF
jgi:hypothetical protein